MLTRTHATPQAVGGPLTHRECIAMAQTLARQHGPLARPWVQVRRFVKGSPPLQLCGQVLALEGDGAEWFKVATDDGPVWVEGRNARMCSGDGRCTCEPGHGVATQGAATC